MLPCDCDGTGSESGVCDVTTGQCPCRINVALFGETNRNNEAGDRRCSSCKVNHYGFLGGAGCASCECSPIGSKAAQCDLNGQCPCKATVSGLQCGECQPNFFNFTITGCSPCSCTSPGVTAPDCDKSSGECSCKLHATGDLCDRCKPGYFNLLASNPDGCQKCFCYEHGTDCSSANGYVESTIRSSSATSWDVAGAYDPNYVMAPADFLGNMIYSYGQFFSLELSSTSADVSLNQNQPVVLRGGGLTLYAQEDVTVDSLGYTPLSIKLHESYWHINDTTQPTVQQMQRLLADLRGIYIRTSYDQRSLLVRNIALKSATKALNEDARLPATFVEQCVCDTFQNVQGLSCESCTEGHRRESSSPNKYEACVACDCSDKEDGPVVCDEISGVCLNCRNGTEGDHCERCAPNVINTTECDTCVDRFWGLFAEGCIECACDAVGATDQRCDKVTGQCNCKDKVTGRTCDICEDNYFNLQDTGCQVCTGCYNLVQLEVDKLRALTDNLTSYVQQLSDNDNTTVIGPFSQRLTQTGVTLTSTLQVLSQVQSLEGTVTGRLEAFNNTLNTLMANLQLDDAGLLTNIQSELSAAKLSLGVSQRAISEINATMYATLSSLENLTRQTAAIKSLADSLVAAEQLFTQMASSTTNELLRLENEVTDIETVTTEARNISTTTLQRATEISSLQRSISTEVRNLQSSVGSLNDLVKSINSSVATTLISVNTEGQSVSATSQQISNLQVPSESEASAQQTTVADLRSAVEALDSQADTNSKSTVLTSEVQSASSRSVALLASVRTVLSQSDALVEQVLAASTIAEAAKTTENETFTAAQNMLNTLQNFNAIIADLKTQVTTALESVTQVQALSQAAINKSRQLRESLRDTYSNAEVALNLVTTAHGLQTTKKEQMSPVNDQALALQVESDASLNTINDEASRIDAANSTYVQVGESTCLSLQPQLAAAKNTSTEAKRVATDTLSSVTLTRDRARTLLQSLQNIQDIDTGRLESLKLRVDQNRISFDSKQLAVLVRDLKDKVEARRIALESQITRRNDLKKDIDSLRRIQGSLVHTTN